MTLTERKSRIYLIKKVFSREPGEVSNAIISMLSDYKDVCHTITFDNGGEFSEHHVNFFIAERGYRVVAPHFMLSCNNRIFWLMS